MCFPRNQKNGCNGIFLSNICLMWESPELINVIGVGWEGCLFRKEDDGAENVSSTTSSKVQYLDLRNCNLSDDFFPIALPCFANVMELNLSGNNFKVVPECIKECRFLWTLNLNYCEHLREIRGIPPNLKHFFARECLSLTSSCRSMLLNQVLFFMHLIWSLIVYLILLNLTMHLWRTGTAWGWKNLLFATKSQDSRVVWVPNIGISNFFLVS